VVDAEKSENRESQQVLATEDETTAEAGEDLETGEASGPDRKRRFSPEEARRRKPREVRPRSLVLAPPPPGI
jgi:hypothetical protein